MTESWAELAVVWGRVQPLSGRELEHALQISAEVNHKVTIRYLSTVNEKVRILFGTRVLEILGIVNPEEKNEMMIMFCKEIV
jgi:SPP1 family predicted phage head-tail adaptor